MIRHSLEVFLAPIERTGIVLISSAFWDQISQPKPDAVIAEAKRKILLDTASTSFTVKYRREEEGRDDFAAQAAGTVRLPTVHVLQWQ